MIAYLSPASYVLETRPCTFYAVELLERCSGTQRIVARSAPDAEYPRGSVTWQCERCGQTER